MKKCSRCSELKEIQEFHLDSQKKDGRYSSCKKCHNVSSSLYGEQNKKLIRAKNLKRQYGISTEEYVALLIRQEYRCAICKQHQDEFVKPFAVDHNHSTGKIRGLLCGGCNPGLGFFKEDKGRLLAAIQYLEVHNVT